MSAVHLQRACQPVDRSAASASSAVPIRPRGVSVATCARAPGRRTVSTRTVAPAAAGSGHNAIAVAVGRHGGGLTTLAASSARALAAAAAGWRSTARACSGPTPARARDPTACGTTRAPPARRPARSSTRPPPAAAPADRPGTHSPTTRSLASAAPPARRVVNARAAHHRGRPGRRSTPPAAVPRTPGAAAPIPWSRAGRPRAGPSPAAPTSRAACRAATRRRGSGVDSVRRVPWRRAARGPRQQHVQLARRQAAPVAEPVAAARPRPTAACARPPARAASTRPTAPRFRG